MALLRPIFHRVYRLIEIKKKVVFGCITPAGPGRREPATPRSRIMPKFAIKLLLTSLIVRRGSKRMDGAQLAAALLMLVAIVLVGLYLWSHGQY